MIPATKLALAQSLDNAAKWALEREAGEPNQFTGRPAKELARLVVDAMAASAAQKQHIGRAVVRLLGKGRK